MENYRMQFTFDDFEKNNTDFTYKCDDSLSFTKTLEDESIDLIVTSPPYNIGKTYETKVSIETYLSSQSLLINELVRILKSTGSICWQVGNYVDKGEVFPLDILYYDIFKNLDLKLRNRIIWHFGHGLHASKRFSGRYETLLWFTKSENYTFNLDDVRVPSKYPGKRYFKGEHKGELSCNPKGKNPSDYWEFLNSEWEDGIWEIPNVKSNHPEKTIHPCQFPVELVERCVLAFTNEGDTVYDPYAGVGSSLIAAVLHNRYAVGVDYEEEYVKIGTERVKQAMNGILKTRPLGQPVYSPTGNEKVAKIPEEWLSSQLRICENDHK